MSAEYNICGVLVHTRPGNVEDVKGRLAALSGVPRPPSLAPRRIRASKPHLEWKRT